MSKYFLTFLVIVAAVHPSISVPVDGNNNRRTEDNNGKVSSANFTVLELPEMIETRSIPTGNPRSLVVSQYSATWQEALGDCWDMDSVLVSIGNSGIDTLVRNTLLRNQLIGQPLWTSGQRTQWTSQWAWVVSGQRLRYTNWSPSAEPYYYSSGSSYYSGNCIATRASGFRDDQYKWETANCGSYLRFICAKY